MEPETDEDRRSRAWKFAEEARRFYDCQQWTEAAAHYQKAIETDPKEMIYHFNLGLVRRKQGDLAGARQATLEALTTDDTYFDSWRSLARIALEQKDYLSAFEAYEVALSFRPEAKNLLFEKAWALDHLERKHEALLAIEKYTNFFPDDAQAQYCRGVMLEKVGQHFLAFNCFQKALALEDNEHHRNAVAWMKAKTPPVPRQLSLFDAPAPARKPSLLRRLFSRWK